MPKPKKKIEMIPAYFDEDEWVRIKEAYPDMSDQEIEYLIRREVNGAGIIHFWRLVTEKKLDKTLKSWVDSLKEWGIINGK